MRQWVSGGGWRMSPWFREIIRLSLYIDTICVHERRFVPSIRYRVLGTCLSSPRVSQAALPRSGGVSNNIFYLPARVPPPHPCFRDHWAWILKEPAALGVISLLSRGNCYGNHRCVEICYRRAPLDSMFCAIDPTGYRARTRTKKRRTCCCVSCFFGSSDTTIVL